MRKVKKMVLGNVLFLVCSLFLGVTIAFAGRQDGTANGSWYSRYMWDGNGYSQVWTTNGSGRGQWYLLSVERAGGRSMGYANPYIGNKNIYTHGVWGQPLLDRRGYASGSGRHYPGFAS